MVNDKQPILKAIPNASTLPIVVKRNHWRRIPQECFYPAPHFTRHNRAFDVESLYSGDINVPALVHWIGIWHYAVVLAKDILITLGAFPHIPATAKVLLHRSVKLRYPSLQRIKCLTSKHINQMIISVVLDSAPRQWYSTCKHPQIVGKLLKCP